MEELFKRLQELADLKKIKTEAKRAGFESKKENDKYWNYTFYNKTTDRFFGLHWKDNKNFVLAESPKKSIQEINEERKSL